MRDDIKAAADKLNFKLGSGREIKRLENQLARKRRQ